MGTVRCFASVGCLFIGFPFRLRTCELCRDVRTRSRMSERSYRDVTEMCVGGRCRPLGRPQSVSLVKWAISEMYLKRLVRCVIGSMLMLGSDRGAMV